jgi:hypothetical protein
VLHNLKLGNYYDSIVWVKKNYDRLNGFLANNAYQKIPRDALRVIMLILCSRINESLVKGQGGSNEELATDVLRKMVHIWEGLRLLEKNDQHRI